jgi:hypothetical protein
LLTAAIGARLSVGGKLALILAGSALATGVATGYSIAAAGNRKKRAWWGSGIRVSGSRT